MQHFLVIKSSTPDSKCQHVPLKWKILITALDSMVLHAHTGIPGTAETTWQCIYRKSSSLLHVTSTCIYDAVLRNIEWQISVSGTWI